MIKNHLFTQAKQDALSGRILEGSRLEAFVADVAQARGDDIASLLESAHEIRLKHMGRVVDLCAIVNAKSGRCSEDCAFCAQSGRYDTGAPEHPFLSEEEIRQAARAAARSGARRLGVVTSGKTLLSRDFDRLLRSVKLVSEAGLLADTSCGILGFDQFKVLKDAGLDAYHHNIETGPSFFPKICTTHAYEEDLRAVRAALQAGLYVCCGGIFGLGETWEQRAEFALTLRELRVPSVPVNFLSPIPGTPMGSRSPLEPEEALKIVALLRFMLPSVHIRICGGRQTVFATRRNLAPMTAGASGLMIGDYLTLKGLDAGDDLRGLTELGFLPAETSRD
ncbi:biotin synthase BioB [Fundidesulfovibrio butyratiphilus]